MFRIFLFAAMLLLAACSTPQPTPTPTGNPMEFTVDANVDPLIVNVGDNINVDTDSGRSGLGHFSVFVDGVELSRLSYDGSIVYEPGVPAAMRVIGQSSGDRNASWTLETLESGSHEVRVQVSGEVGLGADGSGPPWGWSMAARTFTVTVH